MLLPEVSGTSRVHVRVGDYTGLTKSLVGPRGLTDALSCLAAYTKDRMVRRKNAAIFIIYE